MRSGRALNVDFVTDLDQVVQPALQLNLLAGQVRTGAGDVDPPGSVAAVVVAAAEVHREALQRGPRRMVLHKLQLGQHSCD